ncbi:MAG: beta/gamma crystallin-related protein [Sphingopyxis sp.]|uniref:beta/gamma crystallin-related protein n=1 Tax=Sphingopyxis sp. TaxID=1908224 RepID=UPI002ABC5413|nr:beta/gamma crystallin-related protein [Sphingopyxis sp.]MDZ3831786.1 beta/gamma crystallin-related protein [Sphingopyxis sp.]
MSKLRMSWTYLAGLAVIVGGGALSTSSAQTPDDRMYRPPEATIYRDAAYRGPAVFIGEAKPNLGLSWPVNSIRVKEGRWQLCEKTRFRGQCRTVDRDTPLLNNVLRGLTIQSIRPVGNGGGDDGWQAPPANGQIARGNFAEFHTQPGTNGRRVAACAAGSATANCAAQTADNWCRSIGWNGSAREHMETINRREYLADVLCVRTGY